MSQMMCGGAGEAKAADKEIQAICDQIKDDLAQKTNKTFTDFTALKYRSQVVAGTNYFVKERVGKFTMEFHHIVTMLSSTHEPRHEETNNVVSDQIQVSPDECIHVRIFEPLPHTNEPVSLHSHQIGKTVTDEIDYF